MENTAANMALILDMIGQRKKLEDYPGKSSEDMIVHEPSSFPVSGSYRVRESFEAFYPQVRAFFDFSRFELKSVFGDGDTVFAIIQAGIAGIEQSILLCEQFTFQKERIVEVR